MTGTCVWRSNDGHLCNATVAHHSRFCGGHTCSTCSHGKHSNQPSMCGICQSDIADGVIDGKLSGHPITSQGRCQWKHADGTFCNEQAWEDNRSHCSAHHCPTCHDGKPYNSHKCAKCAAKITIPAGDPNREGRCTWRHPDRSFCGESALQGHCHCKHHHCRGCHHGKPGDHDKFCKACTHKDKEVHFKDHNEVHTVPRKEAEQYVVPEVMVVFDFDNTIMAMHVWHTYQNADINSIQIAPQMFGDLNFFRRLIPALEKVGVKFAIATFGRKDVVMKAMRFAFGEDQQLFTDDNVLSPHDFSIRGQTLPDGSGALQDKNPMLHELEARFGVEPRNTLLFDDDQKNVDHANRDGALAIRTQPFTGHTWDMNRCTSWVRNHGFDLELN